MLSSNYSFRAGGFYFGGSRSVLLFDETVECLLHDLKALKHFVAFVPGGLRRELRLVAFLGVEFFLLDAFNKLGTLQLLSKRFLFVRFLSGDFLIERISQERIVVLREGEAGVALAVELLLGLCVAVEVHEGLGRALS